MMGAGGNTGRPKGVHAGAQDELPLAGRTVLVAEDEFFVGIELAQTLEEAGADIIGPAWSLTEAEKLSEETSLDMAVLDVNLNGDYALDLAVALKNKGVRVVFATAHADDDHLFRGAAADIPRLGKPTSARALLRALRPLS
ncbi:response regulator [Parvibaculum sp.]|jgi:DNA-binding response OmpR family regulator|uniref:response regulator n=1 Tax=Parvibaculum sp. TaxID=2024848 RepID=UPI002FDAEAF7